MNGDLLIACRPSCILMALIAVVHLTAAMSLVHVFDGGYAWLVAAALALAFALSVIRLRRPVGRQWLLGADGSLVLKDGDIDHFLLPQASSTDFGWAVWLHWRDADTGRRGALMLLRDQLDAERWRRLRVWLRHLAVVGHAGSPDVPG